MSDAKQYHQKTGREEKRWVNTITMCYRKFSKNYQNINLKKIFQASRISSPFRKPWEVELIHSYQAWKEKNQIKGRELYSKSLIKYLSKNFYLKGLTMLV